MKKILTTFAAIALLVSCDESKETIDSLQFPSDAFVSLAETSIAVLESNTDAIDVVLNLSTSKDGADTASTVEFTIASDNAVEGVHYTIVDGKSNFQLGVNEFQDSLQIIPINNADEDGDKTITITLNSAPVGLGFPGPDGFGKTLTLTIQDDDCAFSLASLGAAAWSGEDNVPATQAGPNASLITTTFDGTNLLIEGIGYAWLTDTGFWDEVIVTSNPVIAQVDPITGDVTIALQDLCTTTWLGDAQAPYTIDATGVYTSCSETLVINYNIYQGGATTPLRSFTDTLTIN